MTRSTSEYDTIDAEHSSDDRIAIIRLDDPDRNNVLDMGMIQAFTAAITAGPRRRHRKIVVSATGEIFSAGADLNNHTELSFGEGTRFIYTGTPGASVWTFDSLIVSDSTISSMLSSMSDVKTTSGSMIMAAYAISLTTVRSIFC